MVYLPVVCAPSDVAGSLGGGGGRDTGFSRSPFDGLRVDVKEMLEQFFMQHNASTLQTYLFKIHGAWKQSLVLSTER